MDDLTRVPEVMSHIARFAAKVPGAIGAHAQLREISRAQKGAHNATKKCLCDAFICDEDNCMSSGSCDERFAVSNLVSCLDIDLSNTNACSNDVIMTYI
jgi:hypothetical protein